MADIVIGGFSRWCSAGLIWEHEQKGGYVNLLTFTLDIGYGKFGEQTSTWDVTLKRIRKIEWDQNDEHFRPAAGRSVDIFASVVVCAWLTFVVICAVDYF